VTIPDISTPRALAYSKAYLSDTFAGLAVDMKVYPDLDAYEVIVEIIVTNPDHRERGEIRISDDGAITWECDYGAYNGAGTGDIAETVARILTHEIAEISAATGATPGRSGQARARTDGSPVTQGT
jgi:hypothetical protein